MAKTSWWGLRKAATDSLGKQTSAQKIVYELHLVVMGIITVTVVFLCDQNWDKHAHTKKENAHSGFTHSTLVKALHTQWKSVQLKTNCELTTCHKTGAKANTRGGGGGSNMKVKIRMTTKKFLEHSCDYRRDLWRKQWRTVCSFSHGYAFSSVHADTETFLSRITLIIQYCP